MVWPLFGQVQSDFLMDFECFFANQGTKKRVTLREPWVRAEFLDNIYFSYVESV